MTGIYSHIVLTPWINDEITDSKYFYTSKINQYLYPIYLANTFLVSHISLLFHLPEGL